MTQTIGLKAVTKYGEICITFPLLKETEKAILIRTPQIAGSGCDIFATGRDKEVWIPKSRMKEAGNGYYLKPYDLWERIAPSTALTTAAWVMKQIGADLETTGFPGEMLGEVASKVREAYPERRTVCDCAVSGTGSGQGLRDRRDRGGPECTRARSSPTATR